MPVKPSDNTPIFAEDDTYSTGLKAGRLTKADPGQLAQSGHFPGKPNRTTANEYNGWLNLASLITRVTFFGTSAPDEDAHIVETDDDGQINVASALIGNTASTIVPLRVQTQNLAPGSAAAAEFTVIDQTGVVIATSHTSAPDPVSLSIVNDADALEKWAFESNSNGTAGDSLGGAWFLADTVRMLSGTSGATPRYLSALNATNSSGQAVEGVGGSASLPAARFINPDSLGTSIRAGFGNLSAPPENFSGNAIEARGGDGNSGTGAAGGVGVIGIGGDAQDGGTNAQGGIGVRCTGGASATLPAGPACFVETLAVDGTGLTCLHQNPSAVGDLAIFATGTNAAKCIVASSLGDGTCLQIDSQAGYGIDVSMTTGTGGVIRSAIHMEPQDSPTVVADGDLWVQDAASTVQLYTTAGTVRQTIPRIAQDWCAIDDFQASAEGGQSTAQNVFVIQSTMSFPTSLVPTAGVSLILKAFGTLRVAGTDQAGVAEMRWYDVTDASVIGVARSYDIQGTGTRDVNVHHIQQYVIATPGARTLRFEFTIKTGAAGTTSIDANDFWYEVRPKAHL